MPENWLWNFQAVALQALTKSFFTLMQSLFSFLLLLKEIRIKILDSYFRFIRFFDRVG